MVSHKTTMRKPTERKENQNRRLESDPLRLARAAELSHAATYEGHGKHKRNTKGFPMSTPPSHHGDDSVCEAGDVSDWKAAVRLLKRGLKHGFVSDFWRNGWPKHVWAVLPDGSVYEAKYGGSVEGAYHGYPLAESDTFADEIRDAWKEKGLG